MMEESIDDLFMEITRFRDSIQLSWLDGESITMDIG